MTLTAVENLITSEKHRSKQQSMLNSVADALTRLKREHHLLSGILETAGDESTMGAVASTALFRCLITLKHREGPYLIFYIDLTLSVALAICLYALCFARAHEDRDESFLKWINPDVLQVATAPDTSTAPPIVLISWCTHSSQHRHSKCHQL